MLLIIVFMYIFCWGPLLVFNVLQAFDVVGDTYGYVMDGHKHAKTVFSLLAYLNR